MLHRRGPGRSSPSPASARRRRRRASTRSRAPTTRPTRSRRPKTLLTIAEDFGGWAEAATKFFDEETGIVTEDPGGDREGQRRVTTSTARASGRAARRRRPARADGTRRSVGAHRAVGPRAGHRDDLVQPAGADPARRRRRHGGRGRLGARSSTSSPTPDLAAIRLTVVAVAARDRAQRRDGHGHRLGAGPRPVLGQRRSSTSSSTCRSRCPRSWPAWCCSRSTARRARSGSTSPTPRRAVFLALAFVTLPFVVRTVQPVLEELEPDVEEAAASLGASRLHDLPPDHPAQPGPGDRRRRGAVVRPGDQRVRLAGAAQRQPARSRPRSPRSGCSPTSRTATPPRPPRWPRCMLVVALVVIVAPRRHPDEGWRAVVRVSRPRPRLSLRAAGRRLRLPAGRLAGLAGRPAHVRGRASTALQRRARRPATCSTRCS